MRVIQISVIINQAIVIAKSSPFLNTHLVLSTGIKKADAPSVSFSSERMHY